MWRNSRTLYSASSSGVLSLTCSVMLNILLKSSCVLSKSISDTCCSPLANVLNRKAAFETDPKLVQFLVRAAEGAIANFMPEEFLESHSHEFFEFCLARLRSVTHADDKIVWARAAVNSARTSDNIQILLKMIDAGTGVADFELDQDMRYAQIYYFKYLQVAH